ncbi:Beta-1, 4-galactosyltransferase 7 [Sarcoptes scabiei]|uniref:Beta-1,4-galactosyltransferase 7 n=1 Tax=Sarcoptes scabiei TaxID=52283 RepID=A0A834R758_SARSC|nr:Beta-1, 4-galactosyltransferase 7 [Sarcoptes scabiei]
MLSNRLNLSIKNLFFLFAIGVFFLTIVTILLNAININDCQCDVSCNRNVFFDEFKEQSELEFKVNRLAVIIPFRERFNQLLQFIPHMSAFLRKQNISHQFFVINQVDNYRFNRGALINVGFLIARNRSTYIAMHDVDLLPLNEQLSYRFPSDGPFHISAPHLHPKYNYRTYVGGILLMQNEHFQLVNGFSNRYFGWGLEDDEFYARLKEAHLKIYRPENISTNKSNTFVHLHDPNIYKRDTAKLFNQREVFFPL